MNGVDVRASFAEQVTVAQLAGFATPVLVANGGASPPVASGIARAPVGLIPRARLQAIASAGHAMLDSHPGAVADLVLAGAAR
jgi:pimeloyl-ACP methyl ester carboxylesterase